MVPELTLVVPRSSWSPFSSSLVMKIDEIKRQNDPQLFPHRQRAAACPRGTSHFKEYF